MAKRSREYNQTTTQALQGEAEGISRARFVDRPTLNALVAGLKDGKTISEFLASPESADFAIVLQDAGVLQQTEISSLIYPDSGKLNDAGKARVMQIMRGLVLPDYDIMTSLPKGVLNNLDASMPVLALSRMRGEGMEEQFANDGLRYLAEGRAPSPSLQGIFECLKAEGIDLFIDDNIAQGRGMPWREMSVDEFGNLDARTNNKKGPCGPRKNN